MTDTRVAEVADGVHQLSTYLQDMDFSLNQYVVLGDEPLIWHTGMRWQFADVAEAVSHLVPPEQVRWISFGHVEADECGAMNEWLEVAPRSTVAQGTTGCMISIGDLANREPRALENGEVLDIGGHRLRWLDTPHIPHCWEAGLLYDETTRTLLCGDLFTQMGAYPSATTDDIVGPAVDAEDKFPGSTSLSPTTGAVIRTLAELDVTTLAPMHGPAYTGDCRSALTDLAAYYDRLIARAA